VRIIIIIIAIVDIYIKFTPTSHPLSLWLGRPEEKAEKVTFNCCPRELNELEAATRRAEKTEGEQFPILLEKALLIRWGAFNAPDLMIFASAAKEPAMGKNLAHTCFLLHTFCEFETVKKSTFQLAKAEENLFYTC